MAASTRADAANSEAALEHLRRTLSESSSKHTAPSSAPGKVACDICRRRKLRCDKGNPCSRCVAGGTECVTEDVLLRKGPLRKHERLAFQAAGVNYNSRRDHRKLRRNTINTVQIIAAQNTSISPGSPEEEKNDKLGSDSDLEMEEELAAPAVDLQRRASAPQSQSSRRRRKSTQLPLTHGGIAERKIKLKKSLSSEGSAQKGSNRRPATEQAPRNNEDEGRFTFAAPSARVAGPAFAPPSPSQPPQLILSTSPPPFLHMQEPSPVELSPDTIVSASTAWERSGAPLIVEPSLVASKEADIVSSFFEEAQYGMAAPVAATTGVYGKPVTAVATDETLEWLHSQRDQMMATMTLSDSSSGTMAERITSPLTWSDASSSNGGLTDLGTSSTLFDFRNSFATCWYQVQNTISSPSLMTSFQAGIPQGDLPAPETASAEQQKVETKDQQEEVEAFLPRPINSQMLSSLLKETSRACVHLDRQPCKSFPLVNAMRFGPQLLHGSLILGLSSSSGFILTIDEAGQLDVRRRETYFETVAAVHAQRWSIKGPAGLTVHPDWERLNTSEVGPGILFPILNVVESDFDDLREEANHLLRHPAIPWLLEEYFEIHYNLAPLVRASQLQEWYRHLLAWASGCKTSWSPLCIRQRQAIILACCAKAACTSEGFPVISGGFTGTACLWELSLALFRRAWSLIIPRNGVFDHEETTVDLFLASSFASMVAINWTPAQAFHFVYTRWQMVLQLGGNRHRDLAADQEETNEQIKRGTWRTVESIALYRLHHQNSPLQRFGKVEELLMDMPRALPGEFENEGVSQIVFDTWLDKLKSIVILIKILDSPILDNDPQPDDYVSESLRPFHEFIAKDLGQELLSWADQSLFFRRRDLHPLSETHEQSRCFLSRSCLANFRAGLTLLNAGLAAVGSSITLRHQTLEAQTSKDTTNNCRHNRLLSWVRQMKRYDVSCLAEGRAGSA